MGISGRGGTDVTLQTNWQTIYMLRIYAAVEASSRFPRMNWFVHFLVRKENKNLVTEQLLSWPCTFSMCDTEMSKLGCRFALDGDSASDRIEKCMTLDCALEKLNVILWQSQDAKNLNLCQGREKLGHGAGWNQCIWTYKIFFSLANHPKHNKWRPVCQDEWVMSPWA